MNVSLRPSQTADYLIYDVITIIVNQEKHSVETSLVLQCLHTDLFTLISNIETWFSLCHSITELWNKIPKPVIHLIRKNHEPSKKYTKTQKYAWETHYNLRRQPSHPYHQTLVLVDWGASQYRLPNFLILLFIQFLHFSCFVILL